MRIEEEEEEEEEERVSSASNSDSKNNSARTIERTDVFEDLSDEFYRIDGHEYNKEPLALDICEKLLLIGRYEHAVVMAERIYELHARDEYKSHNEERERDRAVEVVTVAVWIQGRFKTRGLTTFENDLEWILNERENMYSSSNDGYNDRDRVLAFDEIGERSKNRKIIEKVPKVLRLLWAKLRWEGANEETRTMTYFERNKRMLNGEDLEDEEFVRDEETIDEVERVLCKYIFCGENDDEEEEEEEEEGNEDNSNKEKNNNKNERVVLDQALLVVLDQASWLYASEILVKHRKQPQKARLWLEKRHRLGKISKEAYDLILKDIEDCLEPKMVDVKITYNGGNVKTEQIVRRKRDGKKIMRRVQTDAKPEPRDFYYHSSKSSDDDDNNNNHDESIEDDSEQTKMNQRRRRQKIEEKSSSTIDAATTTTRTKAPPPLEKHQSRSNLLFEFLKNEFHENASSASAPLKIATAFALVGCAYSVCSETYRLLFNYRRRFVRR